ncbi:unnamed protein product [Cylicocyclus nassatus]|uniref:ShKT domain-containing protein n=1 Tax=Cylicocyclus nassatus TaxID=53992 RepID=A0AA36DL65_CYLNA|nr:unnamed protein product [Cylicocyclus nassatus]
MFAFSFVLLLLSVYGTLCQQLQECSDPAASPEASPCPNGVCPTGYTCINSPRGEMCCNSSMVYDVTTAIATTATTTAPCVDLLNPRTGTSDCPNMVNFCNNALYYTLMTQQCPKTCNRCPGTPTAAPPSPACADLVHWQTGVSDCPRLSYLCYNIYYTQLMSVQCRRTCGYC